MRFLQAGATSRAPTGRQSRRAVTILAALVCLANCAGSRELTRERAAKLITNSKDFRAPVTLPLKREADWRLRAESEAGAEAEAQSRAVESYYQVNPQMAVLKQLGLIDLRVTLRKRPDENYRSWSFDVEPFLTGKGEGLTSAGQENEGKPAVPLARKELIDVTGIAKTRDVLAQAEYTFREVPTEAGRAFVPGSPEYQGLPAHLQQALSGRNQTIEFGKTKRGAAIFQLYDDGWRLVAAQ